MENRAVYGGLMTAVTLISLGLASIGSAWLFRPASVPGVRWVRAILTLPFYVARFLWFVIRAVVGRP